MYNINLTDIYIVQSKNNIIDRIQKMAKHVKI